MELPRLVLASSSPRRAEILATTGWQFEVLPVDLDESRHSDEDAVDYVRRLALAKAEQAARHSPHVTILGADTVVVIDEQILGKPRDEENARAMLGTLNGRWHKVLTGIALVNHSRSKTKVSYEVTEVKFADLSDDEIRWYVSTGEPMDKAGAYAIQGLGARFIEGIRGDYFNVVGLPLRLLYELVHEFTQEKSREIGNRQSQIGND
jgi:septum formation protein